MYEVLICINNGHVHSLGAIPYAHYSFNSNIIVVEFTFGELQATHYELINLFDLKVSLLEKKECYIIVKYMILLSLSIYPYY